MKLIFTVAAALLLLIFIGCNAPQKKSADMTGVYKMLSQSWKGAKTDTSSKTILQQKIYTGPYMMYASFNSADSSVSFGIGTYSANADTVTETFLYRASDSSVAENSAPVKLLVEKNDSGYKQVIPEMLAGGEKYMQTETYKKIDSNAVSPLDGAWKREELYLIKGHDTAIQKVTQYKVYGGGYFMWGHTYTDSLNKTHAGMCYGNFSMEGNNKVKETIFVSGYKYIIGLNFTIATEMNGPDAFKQTIDMPDSSKQVEIYRRLK
jgi:hypothetical protein